MVGEDVLLHYLEWLGMVDNAEMSKLNLRNQPTDESVSRSVNQSVCQSANHTYSLTHSLTHSITINKNQSYR